MKYDPQPDDDKMTSMRVPKRVRRKLGLLMNGNEYVHDGLERILDGLIKNN